jgi:hypothetical protein
MQVEGVFNETCPAVIVKKQAIGQERRRFFSGRRRFLTSPQSPLLPLTVSHNFCAGHRG